MTSVNPKGTATIEDLCRAPDDGRKYELVDGEILVSAAGVRHGEVAGKILHLIATYLENSPIGIVLTPDVGLHLPSGNVRSPDVTFVRNEKLPDGRAPETFGEFVPDLAVEVLSPSDSMRQVAAKIGEFLDCGVPIVWLVDPGRGTVTVYRSLSETRQLQGDDRIDANGVLPGFSCPVSAFF